MIKVAFVIKSLLVFALCLKYSAISVWNRTLSLFFQTPEMLTVLSVELKKPMQGLRHLVWLDALRSESIAVFAEIRPEITQVCLCHCSCPDVCWINFTDVCLLVAQVSYNIWTLARISGLVQLNESLASVCAILNWHIISSFWMTYLEKFVWQKSFIQGWLRLFE